MKYLQIYIPVFLLLFLSCEADQNPHEIKAPFLEAGETNLEEYLDGDLDRVDAYLDLSEHQIYGTQQTLMDLQQALNPQISENGWNIADSLLTDTPQGNSIFFEVLSLSEINGDLVPEAGDYATIKDFECTVVKKGTCMEIVKDAIYITIPSDLLMCQPKDNDKCTGVYVEWPAKLIHGDKKCKTPKPAGLKSLIVLKCNVL